ncbi:helix-turn-helix domain-containing protein [Arcobacteraceae bacterium]|nr:helix-turn-helix domain-containing protein [Arcobacteraceae bacterium]
MILLDMQRKNTRDLHIDIANKTMAYIYKYIDTTINLDELALNFKISKKHLHHIFKEQFDINIYESIKSIRLQKASNILLTNKYSTITQIANMCGYSSQSSFIKAFKNRFEMTPKEWRNGGFEVYSDRILKNSLLKDSLPNFDESKVKIVKTEDRLVYYIRQKGYIVEEAKQKWQQLQALVYTNELSDYEEIGIYHDNPAITPHDKCFYVAVISTTKKILNTNIPFYTLEGGLYATFDLYGGDREAAWFVKWAYHKWLPQSGFETTTKPSFLIMHKNHFLEDNDIEATFYLPISSI